MSVLARARVILSTDVAEFRAGLSAAESALRTAGEKMSSIGRDLSTKITLPIAAAGGVSIRTASQFDESLRKIAALTATSAETVQSWREDVRKLAVQYGATGTAAAEALFSIASSGITGAAAMEALEASLIGAAIGLGDAATVSDAATSAMNAYAKSGMTATRATEILAAGINFGKMEATQLAPVLGSLTGTSSALGISFEDVVGTLAVFSLTGTNASEGATQLGAIMSTLLGTSGEAEKALADVGLTLGQLREVAAGPGGLINVMRLLNDRFDGQLDKLALVIPNIRAFRGVMNALAQDTASVDKVIAGVTNSHGNLTKSLQEMEGPAMAMRRAWSQLTDAAIAIGEVLAPVVIPAITTFAGLVQQLAKDFADLSPMMQDVVLGLTAIAAAVGPLLLLLGGLSTLLASISLSGLIIGFGTLGSIIGIGAPFLLGLAFMGTLWYQARVEMDKAAKATKDAQNAMDAAFRGIDPTTAQAKIDRFNVVIARFTTRQNELKTKLQETETFLRTRLGDAAFEGRTFSLQSLSRPVKEAWREFERLTGSIEDVGAQIDNLRRYRDILQEVIAAHEAAQDAATGPGTPGGPPAPPPIPTWVEPMKDVTKELDVALRSAEGMGQALGDEFNVAEAQASAYLNAVKDLIAAGVPLDQVVTSNGQTVRDLAGQYQRLSGEVASAAAAQDAFEDAMALAQRAVEAAKTPQDAFLETVAALQLALDHARISQEQYNAALAAAMAMMDEGTTQASEMKQALLDLTGRAVDNFLDMALAGKQSFGDFVRSALYDLSKLILKLQLMRFLVGEDGTGGLFGKLKIPGFARGGFLNGGEVGLVGERGPELIAAGRGGVRITPMPAMAAAAPSGGSAPNLSVNVSVNAIDSRGVAEFFEQNEGLVAAAMMRAGRKSGLLSRGMGGG